MSDAQNKSEKTGDNLGKCQRIKEGMVSRLDFLTGAQTKSGKATPSAEELKRANTAVVVANFTKNCLQTFRVPYQNVRYYLTRLILRPL